MIPRDLQLRIALTSLALTVLGGCSALELTTSADQQAPQAREAVATPPEAVEQKPITAPLRLPAARVEAEAPPTDATCKQFFPLTSQNSAREACAFGHGKFETKSAAMDKCRSQYHEQTRLTLSCFVGASLTSQPSPEAEDSVKFKSCQAEFPISSELDVYLQEACLVGISLPTLTGKQPKLDLCRDIASERAFYGPCGVGLSLAANPTRPDTPKVAAENSQVSAPDSHPSDPSAKPEVKTEKQAATTIQAETNEQNQMCDRYFNKTVFHTGYRACLNSRTLALNWTGKYKDILKTCSDIISDPKNDTERASCIIGVSIWRHLTEATDAQPVKGITRFAQCGDGTKVTYQDKGYLACLTAASLLDFLSKPAADHACKDVFNSKKSKIRSECRGALGKFHGSEQGS